VVRFLFLLILASAGKRARESTNKKTSAVGDMTGCGISSEEDFLIGEFDGEGSASRVNDFADSIYGGIARDGGYEVDAGRDLVDWRTGRGEVSLSFDFSVGREEGEGKHQ